MKRIKLRTWIAICALAMATCLGLTACSSGPSAEEVIAEGITTTLDQVKTLDDDTLDEIVAAGKDDLADLNAVGIDARELFKTAFDGFDYKIESVTVDDDLAKADLTITAKSFIDAQAKAEEITLKWLDEADTSIINMNEDQINAKVGELAMRAISETEPKTSTVRATFTKNGDEWSCDDDLISKVVNEAFFA